RRLLKRWFDDYRTQFEKYDEKLQKFDATARPAMFEVSFGLPTLAGDTLSTTAALTIQDGDETIRITGRIDRIDVGSSGSQAVFCIIDYKTSARQALSRTAVLNGSVLQLPLYSVAAQQLFFAESGEAPLKCGYWIVGDGGFKDAINCREQTLDGLV